MLSNSSLEKRCWRRSEVIDDEGSPAKWLLVMVVGKVNNRLLSNNLGKWASASASGKPQARSELLSLSRLSESSS